MVGLFNSCDFGLKIVLIGHRNSKFFLIFNSRNIISLKIVCFSLDVRVDDRKLLVKVDYPEAAHLFTHSVIQ